MFTQDSSCLVLLWILPASCPFRVRGFHPLWQVFPGPFCYRHSCFMQSEPHDARTMVWALPRSLAATCGIILIFSSSGYLDVSVHRVSLPYTMYSCTDTSCDVGSPIQISPDQCLFAAPRSFSQLITSFVGSQCQGIRPASFVSLTLRTVKRFSRSSYIRLYSVISGYLDFFVFSD